MNKHKSFALTVSLMLLAWLTAAAGSKTVVKAQLDSATLLMGRTVKMHVEITGPDVQGFLSADQADTLNSRVEIAARLAGDTTKMGDGRRRIERDFLLQAFDSGLYVIKPLTYITGTDTAFSNTLTLKVLPVNVDTLADIHPLKPVIQIPFRLGDMIPSFISDYWWA